ncbi:amino acid permease [Furfurilactobacillus entadae]|uniref:amino acid permease n=1 Tax=Furfurilactobacillus entadae TaxID=2922307 RepID=UPI0035EF2B20
MDKEDQQLSRSLKSRHIQMIAIGGAIGTGLFLGSGTAIREAGPSIILAYFIAGSFCFFLMRSIGELLLSDTNLHSFIDFIKRYLGNRFEFVTGWTYWFCWITIAMADLTASGIYMRFWFPHFPQWATPLIIILLLMMVNLADVGLFGEMESWFAMIKVVAILAMIAGGLYLVMIGYKTPTSTASFKNLVAHGGFFPTGVTGFLNAFQMVIFAFVGIEMVGLTAGETEDPEKNLPKAINNLPIRIGLFYIGSMVITMAIYPWNKLMANQSPFVQVFSDIGIQSAAAIINFVVLTAAMSACNSAIFSTSRTLRSLAVGGNAPRFFAKLNKRHVPNNALQFSSLVLFVVVILNYLIPKGVFNLVSGVATMNFIFVWSVLIIAHLAYRKRLLEKHEQPASFTMPFFPYSNYLTLTFFFGVLIVLLFEKNTRVSIMISAAWFVIMFAVFEFYQKHKQLN